MRTINKAGSTYQVHGRKLKIRNYIFMIASRETKVYPLTTDTECREGTWHEKQSPLAVERAGLLTQRID